jgi:hypothetical protein
MEGDVRGTVLLLLDLASDFDFFRIGVFDLFRFSDETYLGVAIGAIGVGTQIDDHLDIRLFIVRPVDFTGQRTALGAIRR